MPVPELAVLDGVVLPAAEATIPVTDPGLLRGDGVFESIRVFDGMPFAVDEHLARMDRSAHNLRQDVDVEVVREDLWLLLGAAGPYDGVVRFVVTRGGRRIGLAQPIRDRGPSGALRS